MTTPIGASAEEMYAHARRLEAVASDLEATKRAGEFTRPGAETYGRLCVAVPVLLELLQSPLVSAITAAGESVRATADTVRAIATGFQNADDLAGSAVGEAGVQP